MKKFDTVKIMNSHLNDSTLAFWVRTLNNGESEFWIEAIGNPQRDYNEQGELISGFPIQETRRANNLREILKLNIDWHFGTPDFGREITSKYKDEIWEEFENRKAKANEEDRKKIELVKLFWEKLCGNGKS